VCENRPVPRALAAVVVLVAGCSRSQAPPPKGDLCETFVDRVIRLAPEVPEVAQPKQSRDVYVAGCRRQVQLGKVDPIIHCVVDAADDVEIEQCMRDGAKAVEKRQMDEFMGPLYDAGARPVPR